ncbi:3-deoxy-7-phosphoheptulonate synthase [Desulfonema ishimotonii]|uniref:Phospho-2-dehydro-3-deoxyheptonate aldolase n=1 Tax=Desulfonema ishimotonii TaxID=45657 RepID=A0A401FWT5_9BACT|nr:3-deoxy-7-phosphoheptulonate synthase [Desulfonema ishimotonii]GBC61437.1 3-deoxy-7-phosphoheptulonate synthase [Desulfonema ishimotonii]
MNPVNIDAPENDTYINGRRTPDPASSSINTEQVRPPMSESSFTNMLPPDSGEHTFTPLIEPAKLKQEMPISGIAEQTVLEGRDEIKNILLKTDPRLLVVVGPCSIHDEKAALAYAEKLRRLKTDVSGTLCIVMRAYFEKPRTNIGWKGLLNDPCLNGSCDMSEGLRRARQLLLDISEMGLPVATEMLDPSTPAYLSDLVSWTAIGARTTESQTHREMASGLPMPVGFKNSTDGSLSAALNAIKAASMPQSFPGVSPYGRTCIVRTAGNPWGHVVLRGGKQPNYHTEDLEVARRELKEKGLADILMIDCSHGNSRKDYRKQANVLKDVLAQRTRGNSAIIGLMLESNLHAGNQPLSGDLSELKYGVSITDACISWDETQDLLLYADRVLRTKG